MKKSEVLSVSNSSTFVGTQDESLISFGTASKALGIKSIKLIGFLRENLILSNEKGDKHNMPHQYFVDRGYFEVKTNDNASNDIKKEGLHITAYITGAGMIWLEKYLNKNY